MTRTVLLALGVFGCATDPSAGPPCADHLDEDLVHETRQVDRYLYNDVPVYLFHPDCRGCSSTVVRQEDCTALCTTGTSRDRDGGCDDFHDRALYRGTVWDESSDDRDRDRDGDWDDDDERGDRD